MPKSPSVPMKWDAPKERALALAFEGRWTRTEIAEQLRAEFADGSSKFHLSIRALTGWFAHPEFQTRLATMRENLTASLAGVVYADKASRIVGLSQMAESARREYEARPWLQERRPTMDGEIVNESFNRDAHAAFREALNDIAKELGERSSNLNVNAKYQALNVTVIMERMRSDRSIARQADDLLAQLTGGSTGA